MTIMFTKTSSQYNDDRDAIITWFTWNYQGRWSWGQGHGIWIKKEHDHDDRYVGSSMAFEKVSTKMLYIGTTNDGISNYMMNWRWKWGWSQRDRVGVWVIFESQNPPVPSRHAIILTMSNFSAYRNNLKKIQCWLHSQVTVLGQHEPTLISYS